MWKNKKFYISREMMEAYAKTKEDPNFQTEVFINENDCEEAVNLLREGKEVLILDKDGDVEASMKLVNGVFEEKKYPKLVASTNNPEPEIIQLTAKEQAEINASIEKDKKRKCIEKCECGCEAFKTYKQSYRVFQMVKGLAEFQYERIENQDTNFECCKCGKKYPEKKIRIKPE